MGGNTLGFEYPAFLVDETRKKLFDDNLELVPEIASRYGGRGVEVVDLIWYGTQGLYEAAETFNFNGRYQFKYYAMYYIRKHITRKWNSSLGE